MRYQVAFFGHQLVGGTPRGALRAFRFLAEEIARQEDIDLICLGEPVSDPGDPLGSAYQAFDGRMFLATLDHSPQSIPAVIRPHDPAQLAELYAWPGYLRGLRAAFRKTTPLWV